jgi:hypothetical protein
MIKNIYRELKRCIVLWGFAKGIVNFITSTFNRSVDTIERVWAHAKLGYRSHDFDYGYWLDMCAWKLNRLHKCLDESPYVKKNSQDMKALKEAIAIFERISADDYDVPFFKALDKKWGKRAFGKLDLESNTYKSLKRSKIKTEADNIEYRLDIKKGFKEANKARNKDLSRLNVILKKHLRSWWN